MHPPQPAQAGVSTLRTSSKTNPSRPSLLARVPSSHDLENRVRAFSMCNNPQAGLSTTSKTTTTSTIPFSKFRMPSTNCSKTTLRKTSSLLRAAPDRKSANSQILLHLSPSNPLQCQNQINAKDRASNIRKTRQFQTTRSQIRRQWIKQPWIKQLWTRRNCLTRQMPNTRTSR